MPINDFTDNIQSQPAPFSSDFGSEKRLKNTVFVCLGYAASGIGKLDDNIAAQLKNRNSQFSLTIHCLNRVMNEIRPDLIQLIRITPDSRRLPIIPDDFDAMLQLGMVEGEDDINALCHLCIDLLA